MALVWKHCANCSAGEPEGQPIAALLTSASSLKRLVSASRKELDNYNGPMDWVA